jgi:hypothetical protein
LAIKTLTVITAAGLTRAKIARRGILLAWLPRALVAAPNRLLLLLLLLLLLRPLGLWALAPETPDLVWS